ncbi:hypothetical protein ABZY19_30340 [Streptomyces sp. NPDC006475]|uniref:hypothetical protein n=1 Tax=Streptomyces sp. NPDC006475 TaxID=3155719 RepID=UPI0033B95991
MDPQMPQKVLVRKTYEAMWAEQMKAYRKANPAGTQLKKYAVLNALSLFEADLAHMRKHGTVIRGTLGHEPTVAAVDMAAKPPSATVSDCADLSKWTTIKVKTGAVIPLPKGQPLRYRATATAERWDGRWVITTYETHGEQAC